MKVDYVIFMITSTNSTTECSSMYTLTVRIEE